MDYLVNISVVFLSALSHAFFQLDVGGLLLLYHASLGKHVTKKTRTLASNFILGVSTMILLCLMASAFLILVFFAGNLEISFLSTLVGLLFAVSLLIFTIYYRSGRSTELWLPRSVTKYINSRANVTSSRIEAFSLGMLTSIAEIPFSLVLFILAADSLLKLSPAFQLLAIFLYTVVAVLPLLICRVFVRQGKTIAEIQRWRIKNKSFLRFIGGIGFIILALFVVAFKIAGELF